MGIKISTKGRYGLKILFDLAYYGDGKPISLSSIAERNDLPLNYLEQIMMKLKKTDMINSVRGAYGGYVLNKPASQITVKDVLVVLEGPFDLTDCLTDEHVCDKTKYCSTRLIYQKITEKINEVTAEITLQDMVDDRKEFEKERDVELKL